MECELLMANARLVPISVFDCVRGAQKNWEGRAHLGSHNLTTASICVHFCYTASVDAFQHFWFHKLSYSLLQL